MECQEGSAVSLLYLHHKDSDNLVVIIDYNKLGATDFINNTGNLSPLKKLFHLVLMYRVNGHSFNDINKNLKS